MVQNIHPQGVIWTPSLSPYVVFFPFSKLLSKCSILKTSLVKAERTKQMEAILRAKVKIFFKSETFKKCF